MTTATKSRPPRAKIRTVRVLPTADYVQPVVFEEITGYTIKAQERKREEGVWVEDEHWVKAPDGRVLMCISGFNKWATSNQKLF